MWIKHLHGVLLLIWGPISFDMEHIDCWKMFSVEHSQVDRKFIFTLSKVHRTAG